MKPTHVVIGYWFYEGNIGRFISEPVPFAEFAKLFHVGGDSGPPGEVTLARHDLKASLQTGTPPEEKRGSDG